MLYFTIYCIDLSYRRVPVDFKISLTTSTTPNTLSCFPCISGVPLSPTTTCLCKNCAPGRYGPDCSINMIPISSGQTAAATVNGPGMAFFRIDENN